MLGILNGGTLLATIRMESLLDPVVTRIYAFGIVPPNCYPHFILGLRALNYFDDCQIQIVLIFILCYLHIAPLRKGFLGTRESVCFAISIFVCGTSFDEMINFWLGSWQDSKALCWHRVASSWLRNSFNVFDVLFLAINKIQTITWTG